MIHPSLVKALRFPTSLVPIIVETSEDIQPIFDTFQAKFGLSLNHQMPKFNMFSGFVRPEFVEYLPRFVGVKNIYYDEMKYALFSPMSFMPFAQQPNGQLPPGWISTYESRKIIGADIAESQGFDGKGIKVAVLDTGIRQEQPQIRMGADDYNAQIPTDILPSLPMFPKFAKAGIDENGHGTHCATTIAGHEVISPLGVPVKGVAPRCSLTTIKVLGYGIGAGLTSDVIKGMEMAIDLGAHIVSMSLGSEGGDNSNPECKIVNDHPEIAWIIAAGNSGPGPKTVGSPGAASGAITVGSYSITDKDVAFFSSRGPTPDALIKPDITAPGGGRFNKPDKTKGDIDEFIYSGTALGSTLDAFEDKAADGFAPMHGTSMATPHAAGFYALLLQAEKVKTPLDFMKKMQNTTLGKDNSKGFGLIHWNRF